MYKVRVACSNVFWLLFGYRKAVVPAKCLLAIICDFEGRMRKHMNDFTMRVGSSNNILIIAMLGENRFVRAGPLRQKWVRTYCILKNPWVHDEGESEAFGQGQAGGERALHFGRFAFVGGLRVRGHSLSLIR